MDIRLPLVAVLIAGGLVTLASPLFAPDAQMSGGSASETAAGDTETALPIIAPATGATTWGHEVTLDRQSDGHFYADVSVDGVASRMLVDTGASTIALTGDDARAMGLHWDPAAVQPVAQGASGAVYGVHTTLNRVQLGNFEATNVPAMIIPEGLSISLLGQSFLSTIRTARIEGDQMVLEN